MARKQVGAIDSALLDRVDEARGDVPRTRFVERALEAALGGKVSDDSARAVAEDGGLPPPRPASPRASARTKEPVAETPLPKIARWNR